MNQLQVFNNAEFGQMRTLTIHDEPWFVGRDVATALGYSNPSKTIKDHVDSEDKGVTKRYTLGGEQELTIINESGLYSLILSSKLPSAKRFKRWVTSEVLPSIRKNGGYIEGQETLSDEELMAKALMVAQNTIKNKNKEIERLRPKEIFANAVAASQNSILIGELAKILRQNGVAIGQNRLFEWMRDKGYLIRRNGADRNMPTQRSMEMGLFEIKETVVSHSDGHTTVNKTPKVTGKGQQYFINLFLNREQEG